MGEAPKGYLYGHLELLLLAAVRSQPSHGFAIMEELERKSRGEFQIASGTLYPALHRLEEEGFLSSKKQGQVVVYQITAKGRRRLEEQETSWNRFASAMRTVLESS